MATRQLEALCVHRKSIGALRKDVEIVVVESWQYCAGKDKGHGVVLSRVAVSKFATVRDDLEP